jgi:hypothetical protein
MLGVFRRKKGALMVIEPPGQLRIRTVFEIDDRILIAIKQTVFEQLGSLMRHSGEEKLGLGIVFILDKTAKERRGSSPVETVIVVENSYPHAS